MSTAKQNVQVLDYIHEHGSIDTYRAFDDLKICRLSARIYDLKAMGVPITGVMHYKTDEHGKRKIWKEYFIDGRV